MDHVTAEGFLIYFAIGSIFTYYSFFIADKIENIYKHFSREAESSLFDLILGITLFIYTIFWVPILISLVFRFTKVKIKICIRNKKKLQ
jgi:hypothetical protein